MIEAAVLLIIYNNKIIFIKRRADLKQHSGEVSFPGGKFDPEVDNSLMETAIREVEEEIGLCRDYYKILYELPVQQTVSTNFLVHTFVAKTIRDNIDFKINCAEVERIILIPVNHFFNEKRKVKVPLKFNNSVYLNTFYYFENYLIWGATSRILDTFLEKITNERN